MDSVKKAIKKIRRQGDNSTDPSDRWGMALAESQARNAKVKMWETDKRIKRDMAFAKARVALEDWREEQRLKKERQAQIATERLRNLRKARRTLARLREEET